MSDTRIFEFLNNIYEYKPELIKYQKETKNITINNSKIIVGNYQFPLNSAASIKAVSFFEHHDCSDEDVLNMYLGQKSLLLEKYSTENYIDISEVFYDPKFYTFDNELKIFCVYDEKTYSYLTKGQEYLQTVFNLIVTGTFSIVNLYRTTHGNLSLFDYLELVCINNTILSYIFTDLENNHDIIEFIFETNSNLKYFVSEYLLHILFNPQKPFVYKYLYTI